MQNLNPQTLRQTLKNKLASAGRIAILGVGSDLRGDDAVGLAVAEALLQTPLAPETPCRVFNAGTVPENLTGELKRYQPTHLVIIDAADFSATPGTIARIDPDEAAGISFSTHTLPLSVFISYLGEFFPCEFLILGIQPKTLDFAAPLSPEVATAAKEIATALRESLP